MTCPACGNDDAALLERTDGGDLYCVVCSHVTPATSVSARPPRRATTPPPASVPGCKESPMRRICGVFLGLLVLVPALVQAQSALVYNPTTVEFIKSPDHDVLLPDTQPMLSSYEFRVYGGGTAPVSKVTLGKPTPNADGRISVVVTSTIVALPLSTTIQYKARVAALGPTGESESADSNPFVRVGVPGAPSSAVLRK